MRIYTLDQRLRITEVTHISPFIVDRVCDAYECLINKDDVEGYRKNMLDGMAQLGFGMMIPPEERPTALDKMKSIALYSIATQWRCSYQQAAELLQKMASR